MAHPRSLKVAQSRPAARRAREAVKQSKHVGPATAAGRGRTAIRQSPRTS
jgi:hypothetical protein